MRHPGRVLAGAVALSASSLFAGLLVIAHEFHTSVHDLVNLIARGL
jgi:hypothetical protein